MHPSLQENLKLSSSYSSKCHLQRKKYTYPCPIFSNFVYFLFGSPTLTMVPVSCYEWCQITEIYIPTKVSVTITCTCHPVLKCYQLIHFSLKIDLTTYTINKIIIMQHLRFKSTKKLEPAMHILHSYFTL